MIDVTLKMLGQLIMMIRKTCIHHFNKSDNCDFFLRMIRSFKLSLTSHYSKYHFYLNILIKDYISLLKCKAF